jgi:hypothetical protein
MVNFFSAMPRVLLGCLHSYKQYTNQDFLRMARSSEFLHILKIIVFSFIFHYLLKPECRELFFSHTVYENYLPSVSFPDGGDRRSPHCWAPDSQLMQLVAKKHFITFSDSFKS